jgi:ATP-binding cassette subfamily B protein
MNAAGSNGPGGSTDTNGANGANGANGSTDTNGANGDAPGSVTPPAGVDTAADDGAGAAQPGWLRRMWPYLRAHLGSMILVFGAALGGMVATAALPLLLRAVIDDAIVPALNDKPGRAIGPLLLTMVGLGVVRFALSFVRRFFAGRLGIDVEYDLRNDIFDHLHRLDFARHDEMQSGQLVSRANSDVRVLQMLLGFLPFMSGNVFLFFLSLAVMLKLSVPLTLVALVAVPTLLIMAVRLRDVVYPSSWDAQQRAAEVATVVEEATSGVRVVKGFGQERRELDRLRASATDLFGARMRNARISAKRQATMQTIPALAEVAILALGGWLVLQGSVTLGTLLAFQTYLLQLVAPVRLLAGMVVMANTARAAAERIFELLDSTSEVQEKDDARELPAARGAIEMRGVRFGYLRSEPVLDGLDLSVAPGEVVALVGASGSGKSTVSLLLPRFYDAQEGRIAIDGVDIRDLRLESLRSHLGVVFEDSFLFSDSIRSNIAYGRPDATDEAVERAARWAQADEFIRDLPAGYDTEVGERGLTLSGGQRQRIALARALITDPAVLLLDDATSSVDVRIEEEIHNTLRSVMEGRTTILVAHRRSTLNLADRIVVLDKGRVLDSGTHDELIGRCRLYRQLLAGPDDDIDTVIADEEVPVPASGVTASAWQRGNGDGTSLELAQAKRQGYMAARQAAGAGVAGGPAMGMGMGGPMPVGGAGFVGRLAAPPTPELMAAIDELPPIVDHPSIDVEAEVDDRSELYFRNVLRRHTGRVVLTTALVGMTALFDLAGPYLMKVGIDRGISQDNVAVLCLVVGIFLLSVGAERTVDYLASLATAALGENVLLGLRVRVFAHLQRLGLDYYDREMTGRILTRMTSDIEALSSLLQTGFVNAMVQVATFIGAVVILAIMSPTLSLVVIAVVPPLVIATLLFRRASAQAYGRVRDRIAAVNANLQESISGVRVAQAFNREQRNMAGFRVVAGEHRAARLDSTRLSSTYFPFVELLSALATVLVLWSGFVMAKNGTITVGTLFAYVLYLTTVFAPIQQLSQAFDTYQQGAVALERLRDLLGMPVSIPAAVDPVRPGRLRGEITFEDVTFGYAGAPAPALRDVSLEIAAGETVAFVGQTGAGKSTMVKLAARLYDPLDGRILVDGIPLTDIDLEDFRRQLGYVPQEAFLFTGTIRDNIAYARPDATDAEVEAAARAVGAHDFIAELAQGYLQPVIERGRSLSSGQRQLIALARAELVEPSILILDEATANLDLATEAKVLRAMNVVSQRCTTLLIAHRLQSAAQADRVVVLENGRVIEVGSHEGLLASGGAYAVMWATYMGETEPAAS